MRVVAIAALAVCAAGLATSGTAKEPATGATPSVTSVDPRQQQAEAFQSSLETAISIGREVARTEKERGDLKTLEFLLGDYKKHVAAGDWSRADEVRSRMQVVIKRNESLVADAARRKAQQERAIRERQHRELMAQRERQHQEQLKKLDWQVQNMLIQLQLNGGKLPAPGVHVGSSQ